MNHQSVHISARVRAFRQGEEVKAIFRGSLAALVEKFTDRQIAAELNRVIQECYPPQKKRVKHTAVYYWRTEGRIPHSPVVMYLVMLWGDVIAKQDELSGLLSAIEKALDEHDLTPRQALNVLAAHGESDRDILEEAEEALASSSEYEDLDPRYQPRSLADWRHGKHEPQVQKLSDYIRRHWDSPWSDLLGWHTAGADALEKARVSAPNPWAEAIVARALDLSGRRDKALAAVERLIEQYPDEVE